MTLLSDAIAKQLLAERELAACRAENLRYRDKLLECAKECSECGGTGVVTFAANRVGDCPDCADLRELLR